MTASRRPQEVLSTTAPGDPPAAPFGLPRPFLLRATAVVTGLTLLLIVGVHGVAFFVAWSLIGLALISQGAAATFVYRRRSRRRAC